jgi:hypothetical protein
VSLADGHVELAVGAEQEIAAVVIDAGDRKTDEQLLSIATDVAVGPHPQEDVAADARVAHVQVHPGLAAVEARVERDPEQTRLAAALDAEARERPRHQHAVGRDDSDVPRVLLREEQPSVGCERHVRGEGQTGHERLRLERGALPAQGSARRGKDEERRGPEDPAARHAVTVHRAPR